MVEAGHQQLGRGLGGGDGLGPGGQQEGADLADTGRSEDNTTQLTVSNLALDTRYKTTCALKVPGALITDEILQR